MQFLMKGKLEQLRTFIGLKTYHPPRSLQGSTLCIHLLDKSFKRTEIRINSPTQWTLWRLTTTLLHQDYDIINCILNQIANMQQTMQTKIHKRTAYLNWSKVLPENRVIHMTCCQQLKKLKNWCKDMRAKTNLQCPSKIRCNVPNKIYADSNHIENNEKDEERRKV